MRQTALQRRLIRLAASMNEKAVRLGAPGRVSAADLAQVIVDSEGMCNYCGIEVDPMGGNFDHVLPFANGGRNERANLVRSCATCNPGKFTKSPEEFAIWRELKVTCPIDGRVFRPRWADWKRGLGKYCSRRCAGTVGGRA